LVRLLLRLGNYPEAVSIHHSYTANVALHLVIKVVDVLRGLDRQLILRFELAREARESVSRERVSLQVLRVVSLNKADNEVRLMQVNPDVFHGLMPPSDEKEVDAKGDCSA